MKKIFNTPKRLALIVSATLGTAAVLLSLNATDPTRIKLPERPKPTLIEQKTLTVVAVKRLRPANVHEEINIPIYRVYWDNGDSTKMYGTVPHVGDTTSFQVYHYNN